MATNFINKYVWLVETIYRASKILFDDINRKWIDDKDFSKGVDLPLRTFHKWRIALEDIFGLIIENEKLGEYRYYIANGDETTKGGMHSWSRWCYLPFFSYNLLFIENDLVSLQSIFISQVQ